MNPIFDIDFYKADHRRQYPEGTELVFSNFTPRSSKLFKGSKFFDDKVVVFGIQAFIQEYLIDTWNSNFFDRPRSEVIEEYKNLMDECLGPDAIPVDHIIDLHDLGYLPLCIKAIPEGERVPMKTPVLTIHNTIPEFFWLVNYIESVMSAELWGPMTSATIAFEYKRILTDAAEKTGASVDDVAVQGHDFSFRGMGSRESARKMGMGHLTSFIGSDTVPAIANIKKFYGGTAPIGVSVPATEHSVMCMGTKEDEIETFRRLIEDIYPTGIVSIVSDTWDFWKVVTEYLPSLKNQIMSRKPNAIGLNKVVIRPDSGDPVRIICGDEFRVISNKYHNGDFESWKRSVANQMDTQFRENLDAENPHWSETELYSFDGKVYSVTYTPDLDRHDKTYYYVENYGDDVSKCKFEEIEVTPEMKGAVQCLWETFGGTLTDKGYKLLDEHIGLIYGDSITLDRCQEIVDRLAKKGFASTNVVFGIGSYTYQYNTRDTFGFAMKATAGRVNGEDREIFKDPATDNGTKKSARGYLTAVHNGEWQLIDEIPTLEESMDGDMHYVFLDGNALGTSTFDEVREALAKS